MRTQVANRAETIPNPEQMVKFRTEFSEFVGTVQTAPMSTSVRRVTCPKSTTSRTFSGGLTELRKPVVNQCYLQSLYYTLILNQFGFYSPSCSNLTI